MHTNNPHDRAVYTGYHVADEQGQEVGRIVDVIYDDNTTLAEPGMDRQPTWLVVDPGVLRSAHYLPVAGTYRTEDGTVVSPWDRDWIKSATKAGGDHILTAEQRAELLDHYALHE